jgi:MinD-like ATPase involved in chromosome partitioning or flagellar assembly/ActR/RegA family two-component response regulator
MADRPSSISVLLIEDNPGDALLVEELLTEAGRGAFSIECQGQLSAGVERLAEQSFDVVLLDLTLPDSRGLPTFIRFKELAPAVPIIILTGLEDEDQAVTAVREGAQDYLVKGQVDGQGLARSIRYAVERHRGRTPSEPQPRKKLGRVLAFLGAKGGVGTSTVALNVATALAKNNSVVALELRSYPGTLAFQAQAAPTNTLSDLARDDAGPVTKAALDSLLYNLPTGLKVAFGPQSVGDSREVGAELAEGVVRRAAEIADIVVMDLPCGVSAANRAAIRQCNYVLLVLEADPICLSSAQQAVELLRSCGVGAVGVVVVRRAVHQDPVKLSVIRESLGCEIVGVIPPGPEAIAAAVRAGGPVINAMPESNVGVALAELVGRLASEAVTAIQL